MSFIAHVFYSLRLFKLRTEEKAIYTENLTKTLAKQKSKFTNPSQLNQAQKPRVILNYLLICSMDLPI